MLYRPTRTQLIDGIEKAIFTFVEEGICIDRKEAWQWFTNLTGKKRYPECSDSILENALEQMRLYYIERPSKQDQHNKIKCLLENLVQHGVYSDDTQAQTEFLETWEQHPQEMTYIKSQSVIEVLTNLLPKEL